MRQLDRERERRQHHEAEGGDQPGAAQALDWSQSEAGVEVGGEVASQEQREKRSKPQVHVGGLAANGPRPHQIGDAARKPERQ